MDNMPVLNGLIRYAEEKNIPFHMPGHKNNRNEFEELELIQRYLYKIDCTEIPGLDNLHIPEGIIEEGQRLSASAYDAEKSYFLINGSTCGIYSMIMGLVNPNNKIIIQRDCHRSVFTACLLGDIDTVYINPAILGKFNIPVSLNINEVKKVIDDNPDAKAIVITYPTYYGTCCDLKSITEYAHDRNILVLVDEAHGAHFAFNENLPEDAIKCGADAVVTSLHKSTPAMTQCALLNINKGVNTNGIEFMLRTFQTTSPSYILMASIDASRWIMESRGEKLIDEQIENIKEFNCRLRNLDKYSFLSQDYIGTECIYDFDITKLLINSGSSGIKLSERLRNDYNIQVEMSDLNNILLISSIGDNKESFVGLYKALLDISKDMNITQEFAYAVDTVMPEYKKVVNMRKAYYSRKRIIKLDEAEGFVSAEMAVPYPPGVPVILPGELISKEVIEYLCRVKNAGIPINGLSDRNLSSIYVMDL